MSNRSLHRLRLASAGPSRSDGDSSVRVNEGSSDRAQSTTPRPLTQSPQPLGLAETPRTQSLRTRSSMEDDLRGLCSRAEISGTKRSRAELSDDGESGDEPTAKRDRLLEELCSLESKDYVLTDPSASDEGKHGQAITPVRDGESGPPVDRNRPFSAIRDRDDRIDGPQERSEEPEAQTTPRGTDGEETQVMSKTDKNTPPRKL